MVVQPVPLEVRGRSGNGVQVVPPSRLISVKTSKNEEAKVPPVPDPSLDIVMVPMLGNVGDSRIRTFEFTVLCNDSATISIGMMHVDTALVRPCVQFACRC